MFGIEIGMHWKGSSLPRHPPVRRLLPGVILEKLRANPLLDSTGSTQTSFVWRESAGQSATHGPNGLAFSGWARFGRC